MSYGHDFSDRLSPFLIKELRQGLRGKVYLTLFLVLITALTVYSLSFVSASDGTPSRTETGIFNSIVFLALTILLPLNMLGAVGEERRGRKIELVMLSRIRARGVVAGKWLTGALQSATLASVIAPFIVLRYFAGGVDMVDDLRFLGFSLFAGLAFSAVTMAVSAFLAEGIPVISAILRGIILLGSIWVGLVMAFTLASPFGGSHMQSEIMMYVALATLVIGAPIVLEIAAARLSPEAENHDGVLRIMGVVAGLVAAAVTWFIASPTSSSGSKIEILISFTTVFTGIVTFAVACFTIFSDALPQIPYRTPTDRFGRLGKKLGALFLTPGWRSGFVFMLTALGLVAVLILAFWEDVKDREQVALGAAQIWCAVMWPLALLAPFNFSPARRFGIWLLCQVAGGVLAIFAHTQRWFDKSLFDFIPSTGIYNIDHNTSSSTAMLGVLLTVFGVATAAFIGLRRFHAEAAVAQASRGA